MVDETGASLLPAVHSNTHNNQWTECHTSRRNFHFNEYNNIDSDENNDNDVKEPEYQHKKFYLKSTPGGVYQKDIPLLEGYIKKSARSTLPNSLPT